MAVGASVVVSAGIVVVPPGPTGRTESSPGKLGLIVVAGDEVDVPGAG
jgi:hypothetical protein